MSTQDGKMFRTLIRSNKHHEADRPGKQNKSPKPTVLKLQESRERDTERGKKSKKQNQQSGSSWFMIFDAVEYHGDLFSPYW